MPVGHHPEHAAGGQQRTRRPDESGPKARISRPPEMKRRVHHHGIHLAAKLDVGGIGPMKPRPRIAQIGARERQSGMVGLDQMHFLDAVPFQHFASQIAPARPQIGDPVAKLGRQGRHQRRRTRINAVGGKYPRHCLQPCPDRKRSRNRRPVGEPARIGAEPEQLAMRLGDRRADLGPNANLGTTLAQQAVDPIGLLPVNQHQPARHHPCRRLGNHRACGVFCPGHTDKHGGIGPLRIGRNRISGPREGLMVRPEPLHQPQPVARQGRQVIARDRRKYRDIAGFGQTQCAGIQRQGKSGRSHGGRALPYSFSIVHCSGC